MSDSIPELPRRTGLSASPPETAQTGTPSLFGAVAAVLRSRPEWVVAAALLLVLVATSSQYGWHRDELYFVVAGQHIGLGVPGPASPHSPPHRALNTLGGGSLVVVRLASAVAGAATVVLTGVVAGQLGATSRGRALAATTWAVGAISLVTGHFVDTTTFDILATVAVCSCLLQAIITGSGRWMIAAGAVLGFGLLNKMTVGFVIAVVCACLFVVGPRRSAAVPVGADRRWPRRVGRGALRDLAGH